MKKFRIVYGGLLALVLFAGIVGISAISPQSAQTAESADGEEEITTLSEEELSQVVAYIVAKLTDPKGCEQGAFTGDEILDATGVQIGDSNGGQIQSAVLAELEKTEDGKACLTSLSRCSDYGACSVEGNLATAKGDMLKLYQEEKGQDGVALTNWSLPEFEAIDLSGNTVSSSDLQGDPALLVFLARHCGHSVQTLPALKELAAEYGPQGIRVVGVLVNTDSVEDAKEWFGEDVPYEVWIYAGTEIGDVVSSHLVPSYFIVDADGQVHKRLIGYKEQQIIANVVAEEFGLESNEAKQKS